MAQPDVKVVHFTDATKFFDAVKPYDDTFSNFSFGVLIESLDEAQIALRKIEPSHRILFGAYLQDELVAILVRVKDDYAWKLSSLRDDSKMDDALKQAIARELAQHLLSVVEPKTFDRVYGPTPLNDALVAAFSSLVPSRGEHVEDTPAVARSIISYAVKSTLPPPSPAFSQFPVQLATLEDDDILGKMFHDFFTTIGVGLTEEQCKEIMHSAIVLGMAWTCRVEGIIAGFCVLGRSTPRTISIKNVYVKPEYRRGGVAETMVRALTRYYLGAEPLEFEGAPAGLPKEGVKEEVCLNVKDESAIRLYKRTGFLLGEGDLDPVSGKRGKFDSVIYDIVFRK